MRVRAPANIYLHRAQLIVLLAAIVPTFLTTALGIVLLVSGGSDRVSLIAGILVLAFCASALAGYVLGGIFLRRSASLVDVQNQFLSSVSHELRTPLTSMRMFIDALLDHRLEDDDERRKCLTSLQGEMLRLDDLVGRLIDLSRIDAGRRAFQLVPTSMARVVERALSAFEAIRLSAPVELHTDIEGNPSVLADADALILVLVNLLSNAWKHGGEGTVIHIAVHPTRGKWVALEVRDNGPGIPSDEQRRVFDMFERGRTAVTGSRTGSGIGLAIVQSIVRKHRGKIELHSTPEEGTTFRVLLRRSPQATAGEAA